MNQRIVLPIGPTGSIVFMAADLREEAPIPNAYYLGRASDGTALLVEIRDRGYQRIYDFEAQVLWVILAQESSWSSLQTDIEAVSRFRPIELPEWILLATDHERELPKRS